MSESTGTAGGDPTLEARIGRLETDAADAAPGDAAQLLEQAGALCLGSGQRARGLALYGRAIDGFLQARRYDAAAALCRRLLRVSPRAVRAHATLAWIAVGRGSRAAAQNAIDEYVLTARRGGQQTRAARQLAHMADATFDPDLRRSVADHLRTLGSEKAADHVEQLVASGRDARTLPGPEQREALWERVLLAALMGPAELDRETEPGVESPG